LKGPTGPGSHTAPVTGLARPAAVLEQPAASSCDWLRLTKAATRIGTPGSVLETERTKRISNTKVSNALPQVPQPSFLNQIRPD